MIWLVFSELVPGALEEASDNLVAVVVTLSTVPMVAKTAGRPPTPRFLHKPPERSLRAPALNSPRSERPARDPWRP
jgi:hypothetical protein